MVDQNVFVFVVCGSRIHLDTLHYSLRALRRHSRCDIVVLTDMKRNDIVIDWPDIIDVRTPEHFDHHQASIYLKTGQHRFLPAGPCYCYIDTDVVAIGPQVDSIFARKTGPVAFAADHCRMHQFSSYAVRCACQDQQKQELAELMALKHTIYHTIPAVEEERRHAMSGEPPDYERRRADTWFLLHTFLRFLRLPHSESNRRDPLLLRWKNYWYASQDRSNFFEPPTLIRGLEQTSQWRYDSIRRSWISPSGRSVYHLECDHLAREIDRKFKIRIGDTRWQHWNGGVFLFGSDSEAFLEAWHTKTLQIFTDPAWRTRDQGTLIATAWEFGLQNAPVLPRDFNFIADYHSHSLMLSRDQRSVTLDAFLTRHQPTFVHVLNHFGDTNWDIWNWVHERAEGRQ